MPIYQTTSFVFEDTRGGRHAVRAAEVRQHLQPHRQPDGRRLRGADGQPRGRPRGGRPPRAGRPPSSSTFAALAGAGDHIVSSARALRRHPHAARRDAAPASASTRRSSPATSPTAYAAAIRPETKAIYTEVIGNPSGAIADLAGLADVAHAPTAPARRRRHAGHALPLPADRARRRHRGALGHEVHRRARHVDRRRRRRVRPVPVGRRPLPADDRAGGVLRRAVVVGQLRRVRLLHAAAGRAAARRRRDACRRSTRSSSCWASRPSRCGWPHHVANAAGRGRVPRSDAPGRGVGGATPGCPSSPWHELAQRYLPHGPGAVFAFGVKGGRDARASASSSACELASHLANVGDASTLVIHPARTTHAQLPTRRAGRPPASRPTSSASRSASRTSTTSAVDLDQALDERRRRDGLGQRRRRPRSGCASSARDPYGGHRRCVAQPGRAPATSWRPTCWRDSDFELCSSTRAPPRSSAITVYPSLADLPGVPDLVDVFRRPADLPEVAEDAIAAGAKTLWFQLGLRDDAAAAAGARRRPRRGHGPLPQDRARPLPRRPAPGRLRHRRSVIACRRPELS